MTSVVTIWSDIHCPWAGVAVHRLRAAREEHGLDVLFDQRPWPLEWNNERGTPRHTVGAESAVLANHEPELFGRYQASSWPSTFLPAFELVAAARRALGLQAAEDVDYAVRRAFFREGRDVSLRHELRAATDDSGHDPEAIMSAWAFEPVRGDVCSIPRVHDSDPEAPARLLRERLPAAAKPTGAPDR